MTNKINTNPELLKYQRLKHGYTIHDICQLLRVDRLTVKQRESTGLIDYQHLMDLANLCNVSALYFLNNNNPCFIKKVYYHIWYLFKKNRKNRSLFWDLF